MTLTQVKQEWRYGQLFNHDDPSADDSRTPRYYDVEAYLGGYYRDFVPNQEGE